VIPTLAQDRISPLLLILLIGTGALTGFILVHEKWLLLVALAAIPFVVRWPIQTSLGIFALALPFDSVSAVQKAGAGTTLSFLIGAFSGIILITTGLVTGRLERPPRAALWWGVFVLWGATTLLWAFQPKAVLVRLPTAVACFFFYLAAVSFRWTRKELSAVFLLTILGGVVAAAYGFLDFIHAGGVERATLVLGERAMNPNTFAASLLLSLSLALSRFVLARGWLERLAMMAAVGTIALGVLLSMSRGVLIGAAAVFLVYVYRLGLRRRMVFAVFLLLLLVSAMPALFFARIETAMSSRGAGRFDIWQTGLSALKHYGFIGAGLNNFPEVYDQFAGDASQFRGFHRDPHNIYLGIGVEMGAVGLLLFLGGVKSQFRDVQRFYAAAKAFDAPTVVACEAACWGMLIAGFSGTFVWNKFFWLTWVYLTVVLRAAYRLQVDFSARSLHHRFPVAQMHTGAAIP
jgi:O-antigen ligase